METELVTRPSILLADDNFALLETFVDMLKPSYRILAALHNGRSVLKEAARLRPDIIILDISLGDLTGFEVLAQLRQAGCTARIIFLTVHEDIDFVTAAFATGASGYVFKSHVTQDLTKAIDTVAAGGKFPATT